MNITMIFVQIILHILIITIQLNGIINVGTATTSHLIIMVISILSQITFGDFNG